jgi:hypothetical protein
MEIFHRTWYDAKQHPPTETGRYWCNVKELNDLGVSYYQWNCAYSEKHGFSLPDHNAVEITHWTSLLPRPI